MKDTTYTPSPDQCRRLMLLSAVPVRAITRWRQLAAAALFHAWRYDALDAAVFVI